MSGASRTRLVGIVYAMTNAADNNEVVAFRRRTNGTLVRIRSYATGGEGTGVREITGATPQDGIDPLASQGSLALSRDGRFLFAINAGSGSISSFRVAASGALDLADVEPSNGGIPNSLGTFGSLLYVSNVRDPSQSYGSNITGFRIETDGRLTRIAGAVASLSTIDAQPACVAITPDGRQLIVSELTTNSLTVFPINGDGTLDVATVNSSSGAGPFGSVFLSTGVLLVAEAGTNALSSYGVGIDGSLIPISRSVPSGQAATCWVVVSRDERYAYTSNTGSGTISIYRVTNGVVALMESVPSIPNIAAGPIDSGVSRGGTNFYVLNGARGSITAFRIRSDGQLTRLQTIGGLPTLGAQGLAVR